MPNTYFQFKQFTVWQQHCAMKVCTDSCLFGGWLATTMKSFTKFSPQHILDIGAGTGLLSLMLAQALPGSCIDAVEIDAPAAAQAKENFVQSPWRNRLTGHHCAVQTFSAQTQYDLILSNPPFYKNDLKAAEEKRNIALHNSGLSLADLLKAVAHLLAPKGMFAVLLPYHRAKECEKLALAEGLFLQEQVTIKQSIQSQYFRCILLFAKTESNVKTGELAIKNEANEYTSAFVSLLKDYYLHL